MSDQPTASIWERIRARLEDNPLLLVWGGSAGFAAVLIVVVLVVIIASGGGDEDGIVSGDPTPGTATATPTPTPAETAAVTPTGDATFTPTATPLLTAPPVVTVAPALDFLGALAAVQSQPIDVTFGSASDSLLLPDGVAIDVPEGAFPAPTALSVVLVDLRFDNYLINAPQTRIYILSTGVDVALGSPVVLVIPVSTDLVTVTEFVGSGWIPLQVPPGITTRIEISHFSERTIAVTQESAGAPQVPLNASEPSRFSPQDSFVACFNWVPQFAASISPELAVQVCWQALEQIFEPAEGQLVVDVGCLTDEIESGALTDGDISVCTSPFDDPTPVPTPGESSAPTPTAPPQTGVLAPGVIAVGPIRESCVQPGDDEPIQCTYTLLVSTDYEVSALPAQIECRIRSQIPFFSPLESDTRELSELSALVTVSPRAVAQFDPPDTPKFSLPALVECFLKVPLGGGTFRNLDSVLVEVSLPAPDL